MPQGTPVQCPICEKKLDGFSATDGDDRLPEPGNVALCYYCSSIGIFTEDGLRLPTEDEALAIYADPDIEKARTVMRLSKDPTWDRESIQMRGMFFHEGVGDDEWPLTCTIIDRETGRQLWRAVVEDFGALRIPTGWSRPVNITLVTGTGRVRHLAGGDDQ